jgi:hypothetical protein
MTSPTSTDLAFVSRSVLALGALLREKGEEEAGKALLEQVGLDDPPTEPPLAGCSSHFLLPSIWPQVSGQVAGQADVSTLMKRTQSMGGPVQRTSSVSIMRLKSAANAVKNMSKAIEAMTPTRTTSAGTRSVDAAAALKVLGDNEKGEV